jgi:cell division septation protein DedD
MKSKITLFSLVIILLNSCTVITPTVQNTQNYSEDLVKYLPKYQPVTSQNLNKTTVPTTPSTPNTTPTVSNAQPSSHLNEELGQLRLQISETNKNIKSSQGYKVQIYSGSSREEANEILKSLPKTTDERAELSYDQPNFRVKIGNYISRIEAYKVYISVKRNYPNAIIIPDKIKVR